MIFRKVALIGVGLLGGSLGLAIKKHGLAETVEGYVRRRASIAECRRLQVVDRATLSLEQAVDQADLVILCTPIAQMRPLSERMLPALKPGALVTDIGSVKGSVVAALEPLVYRAQAHFIGSHPMAGAEKMGAAHARPTLFQQSICVLTPTAQSDPTQLRRLEHFWRSAGSRTICMPPAVHDILVSRSSHLPHIISACLVNYVLDPALPQEQSVLCATGFRDTTRIASGSPEMWRDIVLANHKNLSRVLAEFIRHLKRLRRSLREQQPAAIAQFFEQAKQRRDQWCESAHSPE